MGQLDYDGNGKVDRQDAQLCMQDLVRYMADKNSAVTASSSPDDAAPASGLRLPTLNELYRPFVVFPIVTEANAALGMVVTRGNPVHLYDISRYCGVCPCSPRCITLSMQKKRSARLACVRCSPVHATTYMLHVTCETICIT